MSADGNDHSWRYEPVPTSAQRLFRMAWQLETWLRLIVYVELRAARVDWEEPIKQAANSGGRTRWPPSALANDKRLHHMATPHQASLSYLTLGQLWRVVLDSDTWPLFAPYFPPIEITKSREEEVTSIRNRVAHFREPHRNDAARFELFMRDFEPGVRAFCNRYAVGGRMSDDPITGELKRKWPSIGYGIELQSATGEWLYAEPDPRNVQLNAGLEIMVHTSSRQGSLDGLIYKLTLYATIRNKINVTEVLEATKSLHPEIIHVLIPQYGDQMSVTIPAVHGVDVVVDLIEAFLHAGLQSARSPFVRNTESVISKWPEYVLRPNHLLTFYDPAIEEDLLDLE